MWKRWSTSAMATAASIAAVVVTFSAEVWSRRWICDDGLIYVRVARQIVYGYGPVFNAHERTEPTTSTLWTWLLAAVHAVAPGDLAPFSVALGGMLSIAGFAIAIDATRRWHRARGATSTLVPFGALVPLAIFPFWDYATSGLETGLTTFWLAGAWWLLVAFREEQTRRRQLIAAFVFGLGPLVRPELALVSIVFLVATWWIVRPPRRRAALLALVAIALPLAYEVFRLGYYGIAVPLPALAKSAGGGEWSRGFRYVTDFGADYWLWLPLGLAAVALGFAIARRTIVGVDRVLLVAPILCGVLLATYVMRVGGDYMHGRMALVPTLLVLLPALVVPLGRYTTPLVAGVAIWAVVIGASIHTKKGFDWNGDWDERQSYVRRTRDEHPVTTDVHVLNNAAFRRYVWAVRTQSRVLLWDVTGAAMPLDPAQPMQVVIAAGWLGAAGAIAPLDDVAEDLYGLADPIAAHLTRTRPGHTGHEKHQPWSWVIANYGDPSSQGSPFIDEVAPATTQDTIAAARRALACGELKELLDSVREPMSWSRFWSNVGGAISRSRLTIPADPREAERKFCR